MKKIISVLLVAILAFGLSSCQSNNGNDLSRGTFEGNTYTNESLGIKVNIPTGYTLNENSELATQYGCQMVEEYKELEFSEAFEKCKTEKNISYFWDAVFENDKQHLIGIMIEDISVRNNADIDMLVSEQIDAAKNFAGVLEISDIMEVKISDKTWKTFNYVAPTLTDNVNSNLHVVEYITVVGNYSITITINVDSSEEKEFTNVVNTIES